MLKDEIENKIHSKQIKKITIKRMRTKFKIKFKWNKRWVIKKIRIKLYIKI